MNRITINNKDDFIELGNLINIGTSSSNPKDVLPSVQDLKHSARQGSFIIQAKMFSDLSDATQMAEYNEILGDEINYFIIEDKTDWSEESTAPGITKKVCKCFLKFYKFDQQLYEKNLEDLLKKHDISIDDVEEEDAGIILNNKTEAIVEKAAEIKKEKRIRKKESDISV